LVFEVGEGGGFGILDGYFYRPLGLGQQTVGFSREGWKVASGISAVEGWMARTMVVSPVAVFFSTQF
jgi:hypothetical protein